MKIINKKMDYDKVMALPVKPRKKPKKVNMFLGEMANAAVFSSRSEGLPFAVLEAMYFGLPVVASDVKGHMDMITDQKTGLLYPCGYWVACAEQIHRIMKDRELARSISESAQEHVQQYDLPNVQPQVMALYHKAINKTAVG